MQKESKGFFMLKDSSCVEDAEETDETMQPKETEVYLIRDNKKNKLVTDKGLK
jgi:hypothetical protein